jgi:hypothetical protein
LDDPTPFTNLEDNPLKLKMTSLAVAGALFGAAAVPAQASEAMLDLLKILRDKGTISAQDYELLVNASKADEEVVADATNRVAKLEKNTKSLKKLSWAERIKIKGDMRFRYENRTQEVAGEETTNLDRLRVRARVGIYAQVNSQVKAGMRFVSTINDSTSTNESLDDRFESSPAGWDLGYIDYAPSALGGNTNFIFGKMKKPWQKVNDLIWDGDTNPEGIAYKGNYKMDGFTLMPSLGYYSFTEDSSGDSLSDDAHLIHAQVAAKIGKGYKLGLSLYNWEPNDAYTADHEMWEIFASAKIPGTPLTVYGNYVTNEADSATEDEQAWALGAKAKFGAFKAGYEYRDMGIDAINTDFTNSDFDAPSDGHILKAGYKIDKNFSVGATYILTDRNDRDRERDRFQLDLKAKFK